MSLASSDIKLLKMCEYKELAAAVGVACYGSRSDIANRIQGAPHGAFKLKTSIDKVKKSIVLHKKKQQAAKKNGTEKKTEKKTEKMSEKKTQKKTQKKAKEDHTFTDEDLIDISKHLKNYLADHRKLVDKLLKIFEPELPVSVITGMTQKKAFDELALVLTHMQYVQNIPKRFRFPHIYCIKCTKKDKI